MNGVRELSQEEQLDSELESAGSKLVVVDFTASWCGPCKRMAPFFEEMSTKYSLAVFLKVDVDTCPETAASHRVTAMPTFALFKNKVELERVQGADQQVLETKVKHHYNTLDGEESIEVKGMVDLVTYIDKNKSECLNEDDEHSYTQCLTAGDGYLQSDCDEQLILALAFTQGVKLHSLKIKAPPKLGPKTLRVFINQPNTLDFDNATGMAAVQDIELSSDQLESASLIPLKFVKFQNVLNIHLFFKDNQEGGDVTQINYLGIVGTPIDTTNMKDFKRVAGKAGETE